MKSVQGDFQLTGEPAPRKRGRRAAFLHAPNFSLLDWQRLFAKCPIKRKRRFADGDFIACWNVSQTPLSIARITGGCTFGERSFIYLPQHDLLVRTDFHAWAMRNWRTVLCDAETKGVLEHGKQ